MTESVTYAAVAKMASPPLIDNDAAIGELRRGSSIRRWDWPEDAVMRGVLPSGIETNSVVTLQGRNGAWVELLMNSSGVPVWQVVPPELTEEHRWVLGFIRMYPARVRATEQEDQIFRDLVERGLIESNTAGVAGNYVYQVTQKGMTELDRV